MATSGNRTVKLLLGRAGAFLAPNTPGNSTGLRQLLAAFAADINDLQTHRHLANSTTSLPLVGVAPTTADASAIAFTAFTVES